MVSRLRVDVGFLCLLVTICFVYAQQGDYEKLVRALANESSDRQFISTIKKWFTRRSQMDDVTVTEPTKTKIKYLPVYVPYPIQASVTAAPPSAAYYGAYHDPHKKEGVATMYQSVHVMPNSHVQDYYLPYSSQLPVYVRRRRPAYYAPVSYQQEVQVPTGYGYGGTYNDDSYETENFDDDSSEYDTEIVENAALRKADAKDKKKGSHVRKVRRKETPPQPEQPSIDGRDAVTQP